MSLQVSTFDCLPHSPHDVTKEWLSQVLEIKLSSADLTECVNGTATKLFFTLTYENPKPETEKTIFVCVKGGLNALHSQLVGEIVSHIFRREMMFYKHIAPQLASMRLPLLS